MIVVSDTTPLISLMKIGHLDLLEKYFGEVQIPEAVFHELTANPRFADEAEQIKNCQFIQVVKVRDCKSVNLLCRATGLDIGESEAIVLSDDLKADLLLMDEAKGRDVAEQIGIRRLGTEALVKAVGAIGMAKYLEEYDNGGQGDYTKEKYE